MSETTTSSESTGDEEDSAKEDENTEVKEEQDEDEEEKPKDPEAGSHIKINPDFAITDLRRWSTRKKSSDISHGVFEQRWEHVRQKKQATLQTCVPSLSGTSATEVSQHLLKPIFLFIL